MKPQLEWNDKTPGRDGFIELSDANWKYSYCETVHDDGNDSYQECREKAVRRVKQRLSKDEQEIVDGLKQE